MKNLIIIAFASVFTLTGCNTIKGFGQDVSKVGEEVSKTAEKVQHKH